MRGFLIALQFLTVIPLKLTSVTEKHIGWSMTYFPLIGYLIGAILIAALSVFSFLGMQSYVLCLALIILLIGITGGLHLDGLADTADGFFSRKSPQEMLVVMRDSHIGTMGVLSLMSIILAKLFLLNSMPLAFMPTAILLMCLISRWSMVLVMFLFTYARKDGKALVYMIGRKKHTLLLSTLIASVLAFVIWGFWGIALMAATAIAVVVFGVYCTRKIGGITGDTIGATNELTEVLILVTILIIGRINPWLVHP